VGYGRKVTREVGENDAGEKAYLTIGVGKTTAFGRVLMKSPRTAYCC